VLAMVSAALLSLLIDWSLLTTVGFVFALLSALQCGYLLGAIVALSQTRAKSPGNVGSRNEVPRMTHDRGARLSHH
jgi:hypothetical protein